MSPSRCFLRRKARSNDQLGAILSSFAHRTHAKITYNLREPLQLFLSAISVRSDQCRTHLRLLTQKIRVVRRQLKSAHLSIGLWTGYPQLNAQFLVEGWVSWRVSRASPLARDHPPSRSLCERGSRSSLLIRTVLLQDTGQGKPAML